MHDFITALFQHTFIQHAVLAGVLSSFACGITGTYVVVKKISYLGGGIAHAVMGGLGIAYFLGINPLLGALVFALFAAILIGLVKLRLHQNEDTVIGALWSMGMATGIIFAYLTPGYNVDLLSFLFGNILMVSRDSLFILSFLDIVIFGIVFIFYHQFIYICFDEEYARLRGIPVDFAYLLLLCLIALTIVILIQTVGLVLVIALLTLPASIANMFSRSLAKMMLLAVILSIFFTMVGLLLSFSLNMPSGALIIMVAGLCYLVAFALRHLTRQIQINNLKAQRQ
jgi:zinc transport system permease protein